MSKYIADHIKKIIKTDDSGRFLFERPRWNKDSAFTLDERDLFDLHGLMPEKVESLKVQVERAYNQYQNVQGNISKIFF